MKLRCYALKPDPLLIRPALPTRAWMDRIPDNHAYRCLPLSIANAHGWEILSPCAFTVAWNGGIHARDLTFAVRDGYPNISHVVASHFAYGIVTFHLGYLFRTDPGWDLFASGSLNTSKDGIAPLTGVIETDWLPYPFTMNWQMTRPGSVQFEKEEPLCMIFPVPHASLQTVEAELFNLDSDPELKAQALAWKQSRDEFMKKDAVSIDDAVRMADAANQGVIVLSDTGDTVFGGTAGDSNLILEAILRLGIKGRALMPLIEPATVAFPEACASGVARS